MGFVLVKDVPRADTYFRNELSGGTTLAGLVLANIDFAAGRFFVAMPANIVQETVDFRCETFPGASKGETDFAKLVKAFIGRTGCAVLLQDTQLQVTDEVFRHLTYREIAITYLGEVYWNVTGPKLARLSDEEMMEVISSASYWPFSAFFYNGGAFAFSLELTDADFKRVVDTLVGVAVGAFDDRSFLVWWQADLQPFPVEFAESFGSV